ncbi:MAG: tetratricopeptide repeat protein [Prevotella sp.]|nr:tetratricopeptide repeat protein [Prevotella sp.]
MNFIIVAMAAVVIQAQPAIHVSDRSYDVLFHEAMLERQKSHHDATFDLLCRCIDLRPDASEAYFFRAQYYSEMQQADLALADLQRADSLQPGNMTYMETLAQAYVQEGLYGDAVGVVERMYEADKSRQELLQTLYQLYVQQKDYAKAVDVLDRMEVIDGKSERTSLAKSGLYIQLDQQQKAVDEVRQLAERYPNDLNYRTLYANTLMLNDNRPEAYALLRQILTDEPQNLRAQLTLRNYYVGEEDQARVDSLTRCVLLNPHATAEDKIYQLRQVIGENEQQGGDSTVVLNLFRQILAQPSPDADIAELMAAYMDLKKMPRDSVSQALGYVLQLSPDRASARLHLVQMAWEDNDDQRIIDLCQQARQYNPEEMAFYYYQGMAYYRREDTDHALEDFQTGISVITDESSPEIVSDFYAVMGDLLHQKGREREAYAAYDSCLQWKPDNIGCLNNYAYFLSVQGKRLDEAVQMSQKTVKAEPKNPTYLDTYAWILFMQQRYAEARIYIDQTLQNDSTPSSVELEHAGDIYFMCGDVEAAVGYWQQALQDDPQNKLLARKVKRKKYIKQ